MCQPEPLANVSAPNCSLQTSGADELSDLAGRGTVEVIFNAIFLTLIILVTVSGNILVIYAVLTSHHLRTQCSNFFIINLAVTDMSNALIVVTTALFAVVTDTHVVENIWCNICCMGNYCFIIVSMLTLAFISIDRFIAIVYALKYSTIVTNGRTLMVIAYAWFQGAVFALAPPLKGWVIYDYWEAICAIAWHKQRDQAIYYVIVAFVLCFLLPGIVMLVCYTRIMKEARKIASTTSQIGVIHQKGPSTVTVTPAPQVNTQAQKAAKTIRSLLVVVALFFVCMTPFCVTKLFKVIFADPTFVPHYANLIASYFQYMSSVVNPFIYGIFRPDFRQAYKRLLRKIACFNGEDHFHSYNGTHSGSSN